MMSAINGYTNNISYLKRDKKKHIIEWTEE